ncbi:MAG: protein kinase, partial [Planctomycetota bacterium]
MSETAEPTGLPESAPAQASSSSAASETTAADGPVKNAPAAAAPAPASPSPSPSPGAAAAPPEDELKPGDTIGGCRIERRVGRGGMGAVYKATQIALEKVVAVKVLARALAANQGFVDRFLREARLAARLEHENIVQVFDTGTEQGLSYIIMQFVDGETLRDRVRKGLPPVTSVLSWLTDAARGLHAAHQRRVVHRDVKPENLIVTGDGDRIKVADFGLAQETEEFASSDDPSQGVMASANYMSPEHADMRPVDARSDLYSLGVSFYTVFTGRRLFAGESHLELVLRHHLETSSPVTMFRRDVPLTIAAILGKLLQKNPDDRYADAQHLLDDLKLIGKRQLPRVADYHANTSMTPPRLDARSIVKGGVSRALEIQRAMKARGDALISLGQLMTANNFVEMKPAVENRYPAGLPFLWPETDDDGEMPDVTGMPDGHPRETSLERFCDRPASPGNPARARLTRAPIMVSWDGDQLTLELLRPFPSDVAVQHYYDLLTVFPFREAPQVTVALSRQVSLTIQDVPWLVDSHNLIGRRGGRFRVQAQDDPTMAFFTGHHLDQYLDVTMALVDDDDEIEKTAVFDVPTDTPKPANLEVSPLDEARSFLATNNPLAARQVLQPLMTSAGVNASDELRDVAREVADALNDLGNECMDAEDFDSAREWFDHAVALCPDHADAMFNKAMALKKLGQLEYSLRYLSEAIRLRPEDPELYYNRAIIHARAGQWKEAVADLDITVQLNPRHSNAYYNRGIAWEKLRDAGRARQDYLLAQK